MAQRPTGWTERIASIEDRLARIEHALGIAPTTEQPAAEPQTTEAPQPQDEAPPPSPDVETGPVDAPQEPANLPSSPAPVASRAASGLFGPQRSGGEAAEARPDRSERLNFEQLLGGRVFAIVGALIVVLAVTFLSSSRGTWVGSRSRRWGGASSPGSSG
jgi:uncharacterized membrane protein